MRTMIIGAGSLGLLLAAKLAGNCDEVAVVTRTKAQAESLRGEGIVLDGQSVRSEALSFVSFEGDEASDLGPFDFIFLTVKQYAIQEDLLAFLSRQVSQDTAIVCLQNGVGHDVKIAQAAGSDKVLLAVTTEGAKKDGMSAVRHTGQGITYIGPRQEGGIPEHRQKILAKLLVQAGFQTILSKDIHVRIWNKLVINCVINPLTAILKVRNGELLQAESSVALMRELYDEAAVVALASGVPVTEELWENLLHVCSATSINHSSMLQDIMQSKKTEIDSMNGSLLRMAEELQLDLPAHRIIHRLVKSLE